MILQILGTLVAAVFLFGGCTKEQTDPRLEKLKSQTAELLQKKSEMEKTIKELGEQDPGKKHFLTQDLELLDSRILRLKEQAKALNGGVELPSGGSEHSSGGH